MAYVESEEQLFRQAGFLEFVAQDDIQAGEFSGEMVECGTVLFAGVGAGKGHPEAAQLSLSHVEDSLHLLHRRINIAYQEQVSYVEHRIPIAETVQVDPEIAFAGTDDVAGLEVPVNAGGLVFDGLGELL